MPEFVSFNEFVDRTAAAKVEYHRETIEAGLQQRNAAATSSFSVAPLTGAKKDRIAEEFEKMKKFVLNLYSKVTDVKTQHTFRDAAGNYIDCLPVEQQPTVRAAKEAGHQPVLRPSTPARHEGHGRVDRSTFGPAVYPVLPPLRRGLVDPFGKPMACPDGRIPLRRISIAEMARFGRFDDFFNKFPGRKSAPEKKSRKAAPVGGRKPSGAGAAKVVRRVKRGATPPELVLGPPGHQEVHRYAIVDVTDQGPFFGCSTWLNTWNADPPPGVFGLSQLWLVDPGSRVTIESGWQTGQWGQFPALFIFFNPDGYKTLSGYVNEPPQNSGFGINRNMHGFHQTNPDWIILGAMPPPYSTPGGDQYGHQIQWEFVAGKGWVLSLGPDADNLTELGYFPEFLYAHTPLAQSALAVQFGGEVSSARQPDPRFPRTGPMGSGKAPFSDDADRFGEVAFQKQIAVKTSAGGSMVPATIQVSGHNDTPNYDARAGSSPNWGTFFFFGGASG